MGGFGLRGQLPVPAAGATVGDGPPITLKDGAAYFEKSAGVVIAEWAGTPGDVPVKVADLTGNPASSYTAARQAANDASYAPQVPGLVLPILAGGNPIPTTPVTFAANALRLSRCIIPKTGKLRDLAVYITTTGGNVKGQIYSAAAVRAQLYDGPTVAVAAAGTWQILGDPNMDVVAGQQLELGCIVDAATPQMGRCAAAATSTNGVQLPAAFTLGQAALPKLTSVQTMGSFAAPATLAEAAVAITANPLLVIARIT